MVPPGNIDNLSSADLRDLVVALLGKVTDLQQTVAAQRDEIARLKGLKGPPSIKPSGMERATSTVPKVSGGRKGRGKKPMSRVAVEDRVHAADIPVGSRFKGYQDFVVQDLVLCPQVIRFRRERWVTAKGQTVIAPSRLASTAISDRNCAASC